MHRIKFIFPILTGCLMTVLAASTVKAQDVPGTVQWTNVPRQVLAFYYGWYGNPATSGRWVHWEKVDTAAKTIGNATHYPEAGAYDSHDAKLVVQLCREAKAAGITGFIASWWAPGDFHDQGLPLLLNAARRNGLSVTVYFELVHPESDPQPVGAVRDVLYLLKHYGDDPAWLKVDGKPVLFVYSRAVGQLKVAGWQKVMREVNEKYPGGAVFIGDQITPNAARVFDGIHTYNPTGYTAGKSPEQIRAWAHAAYPDWVRIAGTNRIACLTVIPGFDDRKLGRPEPRPVTDRHGDDTLKILFTEAVAANPDWILITSWNEWHEGSEIEPSLENGGSALKTVAEFAPGFTRLKPRSP
jgi:hypothetical protein